MTLFTNIRRLHTLQMCLAKQGRRPKAEDLSTIENAAMLVNSKGRIEWLGPNEDLAKLDKKLSKAVRSARKRNLGGAEVLPAFVECHTHLLYAGSRASEFERRNAGESYLAIAKSGGGIRSSVRSTQLASDKELRAGLLERLSDLVEQGATTVEIKTGYAHSIAEELRHLQLLVGLRQSLGSLKTKLPRVVLTCLAAHSVPEGISGDTWLSEIEAGLFDFLRKHKIRVDVFVESGAFSKAQAEKFLRNAKSKGLELAVHADQLTLSGGTDLAVRLGARSADHVIEIGAAEMLALSSSETVAVLLPVADLYTRLPYPKARAMIDKGVRVALATDHNPGTSPGLDLALVGLLARAGMQMTLPEVIAAYTVNAAAALGLGADLGALVPKACADFLVLRPGCTLEDLFYEVGPRRSSRAIASIWREGCRAR